MSVLTINALNQSYGGSHTLWDVDLVVPAGSRICLMGRNGMGKTTLAQVHHGPAASRARARCRSTGRIYRVPAEKPGARSASATCRRAAIFSRNSRWRRICTSAPARAQEAQRRFLDRSTTLSPSSNRCCRAAATSRAASSSSLRSDARARTEAADSRRADGRNSAEGRSRDRHHPARSQHEDGLTLLLVEQKLPFARRVASDFRILKKGRMVASGPIEGLTGQVVEDHLNV